MPIVVSILIRPFDRMLPAGGSSCWCPSPRCFNPHPAFRPDATPFSCFIGCPPSSVSILIRPFDRMLPVFGEKWKAKYEVSILIRPFDRMLPIKDIAMSPIFVTVSILIRPFDRMLQTVATVPVPVVDAFQSSSGLSTGCYDVLDVIAGQGDDVSILIRPFDRMLPWDQSAIDAHLTVVSILIRPFDRMLPRRPARQAGVSNRFNPHPAFRPDATGGRCAGAGWHHRGFNPHPAFRPDATGRLCPPRAGPPCFNPHPAFRPDATHHRPDDGHQHDRFNPHPAFRPDATAAAVVVRVHHLEVSILIRPFDRMLRAGTFGKTSLTKSFNPHPAFRPDATASLALGEAASIQFQSSSGLSTGCYRRGRSPGAGLPSFNPHPAFRPDATGATGGRAGSCAGFNPHPAFRPDATPIAAYLDPEPDGFQSSSGLSTGCYAFSVFCMTSAIRCFNPHPAFRPDATRWFTHKSPWPIEVSILIRPFDRMLPPSPSPCRGWASFNPHPAFRPDATTVTVAPVAVMLEFQSSSGLSTGCYPPC